MTGRWLAPGLTVLTGAGCALVAGLLVGGRGVLAAAVGALVVLGFFGSGIVPLLLVRGEDEGSKGLATGILLLTYTLRLAVAVAVLRVGATTDLVDRRALGLSVIGCALAWTTGQVIRGVQHRDEGPYPG